MWSSVLGIILVFSGLVLFSVVFHLSDKHAVPCVEPIPAADEPVAGVMEMMTLFSWRPSESEVEDPWLSGVVMNQRTETPTW